MREIDANFDFLAEILSRTIHKRILQARKE
jgi:hypothetical protein